MNYTLEQTHISLYTDKDIELVIFFNQSNYPTEVIDEFNRTFKKDIDASKIKSYLIEHPANAALTVWVLEGLFYWDGIPISNITITFDVTSCAIVSMRAEYFTFLGNQHTSNLKGIHENIKSPFECLNYEENLALFTNYTNAVRIYRKDNKSVFISLFIHKSKHVTKISKNIPFGFEVCSPFKEKIFLPFSCNCLTVSDIKPLCDYIDNSNSNASYWKLRYPVFIGAHPVDEIRFYTKTDNEDNTKTFQKIELLLTNRSTFPSVSLMADYFHIILKENCSSLVARNEDGEFSCSGHTIKITDDNIVEVTASKTEELF